MRGSPACPKGLGDIFNTPYGDTGQIHLEQRFFCRRLPAFVSFDDGRFKLLLAQFRPVQRDFTGFGVQFAIIMAGSGISAFFGSLIKCCIAELIGFGIQ